ncbi:MAG: glycosyltransferase family 39 protein [Anaerolineales bacterium]|nr:glycosyltransferase family 39 protein [Anaerolineales bacterium]
MLNYSETNFIYLLPSKNPAVKPVRLLIFVVIFFAVRLTNLTLLPPYIDELLHISRAFTLLHQRQLFISTEGGKFLQIWLIAPALALSGDPLWTARLVTILIGLLSALGCYLLGKALFNRETGLLAAWLYLLVPYALFLDRLVLNDSLLAMLGVYILLFSLKLVGQASLGLALGLGLSLGLTVLTKLNGSIWWVIPVGVLLARLSRLPKSWVYFGGAYLLAFVVVSPLFSLLPEQLAAPAEKTWLLAAPLPASLTAMWWGNIQQIWLYYQTYLTWPIGVLILLGVILSLYRRPQSGLLLLGGAFLPRIFASKSSKSACPATCAMTRFLTPFSIATSTATT